MISAEKSLPVLRVFQAYNRFYLRRSFHTIHLLGPVPTTEPATDNTPRLISVSHSSWWDVLIGLYVATELMPQREFYGVMDQRQLERYRFFSKLGMIGVDRTRISGARELLDYAEKLLQNQRRSLFVTPQGEMLSPSTRPIVFQPGIAYLAQRLGHFSIQTLAIHYEFWNERTPEAFISLSAAEQIDATSGRFDRKAFLHAQEKAMETQLDALLAAAQRRDPTLFRPLLSGKSGISPVYDAIRALGARLRNEPFHAEHGSITTPQWKAHESPKTTPVPRHTTDRK